MNESIVKHFLISEIIVNYNEFSEMGKTYQSSIIYRNVKLKLLFRQNRKNNRTQLRLQQNDGDFKGRSSKVEWL